MNTESADATEYLSLPSAKIPAMVTEYVDAIEVQRTNEWCKCEWIIHPDDENIDTTVCKDCGHSLDLYFVEEQDVINQGIAKANPFCHGFECGHQGCSPKRRRMRRGAVDMTCPVHTKEGLILGFFDWVFKD